MGFYVVLDGLIRFFAFHTVEVEGSLSGITQNLKP